MKTCSVEGCGKSAIAKGLCDTHRKRVDRHGDVNAGRPERWGEAVPHPLYDTWDWLKRSHHMKAWTDFWEFVSDVGDRPSPRHTLARKNRRFGYSKENFYWREPNFDEPLEYVSKKEYSKTYRKKWEKEDPRRFKSYHLKQAYGITIETYEAMLKDQNGVCAICKQPEKVMEKGKVRALHVDHHETQKVRGILCDGCNRGIGHLKDSIEVLEAALAYLVKHK